jgi:hypothetical protein
MSLFYGAGEAAPDARRILAALARHEVSYLLIGGFAVNAHGYPRLTRDVDVLARPGADNYARLAAAIASLESDETLAPATWRSAEATEFRTRYGVLRLHRSLAGPRDGYDELERRALDVTLDELEVKVIGYDDLIRTKRAAARPQDLADISALEDARR